MYTIWFGSGPVSRCSLDKPQMNTVKEEIK